MHDVNIVKCENYEEENVKQALSSLINLTGGLDWVKPNMNIVIKANLVTFMKPEQAATTHPSLLCGLVKMLVEKGANVVVGDSPGGLYTPAFVNKVYTSTEVEKITKFGGKLNQNFDKKSATFPEGKVLRDFEYTSYLSDADAIINFCKLKSHGMMGMSAATKNLFGTIPGTLKSEYHFRFPNHADFADMLIDLNEYFKPKLCIVDAIVGMEGNGPTKGTPRHIGALLASTNPYKLDLACARIMGLEKENVTTLEAAYKRNLIPDSYKKLSCNQDIDAFVIKDYNNILVHSGILFDDKPELVKKVITKCLKSTPKLDKSMCIGCKKCYEICPAKAIEFKNNRPHIDRKKCISCFCCQEFCPVGAMKVKRPLVAKILN
jgi:uncharacterized protein (DUF362 family)/NAD-dependent dihydropyrimidine dehydrogenase PreA subunit